MKLPKSIKILGFKYDIRYHDIEDMESNGNIIGYHDLHKLRITINNSMNNIQQEATLIHEILEAINYHTELGLEHNQIKVLETAIFQVLKDNKLLA